MIELKGNISVWIDLPQALKVWCSLAILFSIKIKSMMCLLFELQVIMRILLETDVH